MTSPLAPPRLLAPTQRAEGGGVTSVRSRVDVSACASTYPAGCCCRPLFARCHFSEEPSRRERLRFCVSSWLLLPRAVRPFWMHIPADMYPSAVWALCAYCVFLVSPLVSWHPGSLSADSRILVRVDVRHRSFRNQTPLCQLISTQLQRTDFWRELIP